jgi:hypothetical protein
MTQFKWLPTFPHVFKVIQDNVVDNYFWNGSAGGPYLQFQDVDTFGQQMARAVSKSLTIPFEENIGRRCCPTDLNSKAKL